MDNSWITWAIQGVTALTIGALGFFLKRTLSQFEHEVKEQKSRMDAMDKKQSDRMDAMDERLNDFIQNAPFQYALRDDFIRTIAVFDSKLDKILDQLIKK